MTRRLKPIPPKPVEISQAQIEPYLDNVGKGINQTNFFKNRGDNISLKGDTVKNISIGLEDIDNAILFYFDNVIKPNVIQNGNRLPVPVIFGSPERWKSVQTDGFYRDKGGKLMVPLIMFKRTNVEKNRSLGNKLDGNKAHLYQVVGTKYNKRNAYDNFSVLTNRIPSEQYYISVVPDYVTITYECIIFTDYVEQNNKLVESIEFASDSYWGDPERFKFKSKIDSFTTTTFLEQGQDRAVKTSFNITLNGYIIPNTINKDLATASSKFHTKSQIVFTLETVDGVIDRATSLSSNPKNTIGSTSFIGGGNNITNIINQVGSNIPTSTLLYLNTNKELIGTVLNNVTVTFDQGWLEAPSGLPTTSVDSFTFFCNGQLIEKTAIVNFTQLGNLSTLVINPTELSYDLEFDDEIIAIGKFT